MIDRYIEEYGKRLFFLCLKLEREQGRAEELYQETWIRVMKGLRTYNTDQSFYPWLTKVCVNTFRNLQKKRTLEKIFISFSTTELKDYFLETVESRMVESQREDVLQAVSRLDYKKRMVVVLHYYEGYSVKEIADTLSIREGTVKSRLHTAKEELRRDIENE